MGFDIHEPVEEPVEGSEPVVEEPVAPEEPVEEGTTDKEAPVEEPVEPKEEPVEEPVAEEPTELDTNADTFTYGDIEFEVQYDEEIAKTMKDAGLDIKEVSKALYTSDDFSLDENTMKKLYEIFGKGLTDSYLRNLKAYNDLQVHEVTKQVEEAKRLQEESWKETLEIVGNEGVWIAMEQWANDNPKVSEEDISNFNEVMQKGSRYSQKLAVQDMFNKYKSDVGDDKIDLIKATGVGDDGKATGLLSSKEYNDLFVSGEYYNNPDMYDKMRNAAIKQGR